MVELPGKARRATGKSAGGARPTASSTEVPDAPAGKRSGCLGVAAVIAGAIYLLNPTAGIIELLPDTLPIVGNLDEVGATALVFWGLRLLGVDPLRFVGRRGKH